MLRSTAHIAIVAATLAAVCSTGLAQRWRKPPQIGYVYPGGVRQGQTVEVTIGGQLMREDSRILVSGEGVQAKLVYYERPLRQKKKNKIRECFKKAQKQLREQAKNKDKPRRRRPRLAMLKIFKKLAAEEGITEREIEQFREFRRRRRDPKRQPNPQLDERLIVEMAVAKDAAPGLREIRVRTSNGLSNPIRFLVGQLPETAEVEPNNTAGEATAIDALPVTINGQIMPGDVDRFRFEAKKGQKLVFDVAARKLVPYLADAVPGWFQATLTLYDAAGREVAYVDDFRFDPDPVLMHEVKEDGEYILEIRDSIYRGREDFVYRISVGELPFITSVYPLSAPAGKPVTVELTGWNIPPAQRKQRLKSADEGVLSVTAEKDGFISSPRRILIEDLPHVQAKGPRSRAPQPIRLGSVVTGRIDAPGREDVFSFKARKGRTIVAEIRARRLGSPLDSVLTITDSGGKVLAVNDDYEDRGEGLMTHHADSMVAFTPPADGEYLLKVSDAQDAGGDAHAYRLKVTQGRGDFALRVTPSALNARRRQTMAIKVFALRTGGFDGPIDLELVDAPEGYELHGARIPAGVDRIHLTLTTPTKFKERIQSLHMRGAATIGGEVVTRRARPADDTMQAFLWTHLVCTEQWLVHMDKRGWGGPNWTVKTPLPLKIQPGTEVKLELQADRPANRGKVMMELADAPKGLSIAGLKVEGKDAVVTLRADKTIQAGLDTNLLIEVSMNRTFKRKDRPDVTRNIPLGVLPAIPAKTAD